MELSSFHTRNLFLRCMSAIFMFAFLSFYVQVRGLYGSNGVLPAFSQLSQYRSVKQCLEEELTLVCVAPALQLSTMHTIELIALLGALLGILGMVFLTCCRSLLFLSMCCLYLSLYKVGQTFLYFQWDSLLLETGWLCVVVAPVLHSPSRHTAPHSITSFWLVRWLLFRLMFASGVVKLQSGCPTWWGLTALTVHYESQCIPTPLAWLAHQAPLWWHKLCVVATYVIEIAFPLLFFSPIRSHRLIAFYGQVLLQISIVLTGNYNFFNMLTIVLCLSLLDDKHRGYSKVKEVSRGFIYIIKMALSKLGYWLVIGVLTYFTVHYFRLKLNTQKWSIESNTAFTKSEFQAWMQSAVPATVGMGGLSLAITVAEALSGAIFNSKGFFSKLWALLTTIFYCLIAVTLFSISLVPYTTLDRRTHASLPPSLPSAYAYSEPIQLTSSYGLFRRMTGVGGRPEVQLEGANDVRGPWKEYEFYYKPGSLDRSTRYIAPHQPRVDWQMWFAALDSYERNPWLLSLVYRLLQGTPEVLRLLDPSSPWQKKPPKYIRAVKYLYYYTDLNDPSGNWWSRSEEGEYMPVFTADHPPLLEYLNKMQVIGSTDPHSCTHAHLCPLLDSLYKLHCDLDPVMILNSILFAFLVISLTKLRR